MSEPVSMPLDPMAAAGRSLQAHAEAQVERRLQREIRDRLTPWLPSVLHPLLPGVGGTVEGRVKHAISRWFWGIVSSIVFFVVFFGLVGGVLLFTAAAVLWAVFLA
jgi:hypothetical protein